MAAATEAPLAERRALVTGGSRGIGADIVRRLAADGAAVAFTYGASATEADKLVAEVSANGAKVVSIQADAAVPAQVASAVEQAVAALGGLDILINNAGALTQHRADTVDGFEMTIGTNLLGPFALTNLLFGRIRRQIVNVGSEAHKSATLRLDDMHLRHHKWTVMGAYGRSKLAVMLWGLELDRRLRAAKSPVVTQLAHPGWVASNLPNVSDKPLMSAVQRGVKAVADVFANDINAGAAPTLYCLSEPIPPGSYVGVDGRFGLRGGPVLIGRSAVACDYKIAAGVVEFAERETGTVI
ncbi:SDR family NAD(P)-dependent oxidoreductase, partial [Mycobacteriaceae bacterium Msp059]|nr:SDR family NAD(P)-dependent oxidoreductase [Mycobacteriaceae bacterium Msp059]